MHDLSWLIHGDRKLAELQEEAGLPGRNIPATGVQKEDLRRRLVDHEIARLAATAPASVPSAVAQPVLATPVHVQTTQIPEKGIVVERRTEIHAVQEPPIKWLQRKFGKG